MKIIGSIKLSRMPVLALLASVFFGEAALAQAKLVKHGTDEEAVAYYDRISRDLNFQIGQSSLSDLIAYLGYQGLTARDLEVIAPAALAPASEEELAQLGAIVEDANALSENLALEDFAEKPILSTRYLAPRIVDLSGAPPYQAGWRKLVRLLAQPGSDGESAGITSAYLLFDYLRAQDDPEPFPVAGAPQDSGTNFIQRLFNDLWAQNEPETSPAAGAAQDRLANIIQVILVPSADQDALRDGVYFMLFEGKAAGYASTRFVAANFDLPPDPKSDGKFYVPMACGRCHGDVGRPSGDGLVFEAGKPNFLDTDYWHDRIQPDEFFAQAGGLHGVLFDGGPDQASAQYAAAFDTIRVLNEEIATQNERAPKAANDPNYQLQSVRKWQELHGENVVHAPPMERSLGKSEESWSSRYPEDGPLLAQLSRHCYRCHNTIDFNVFLKPRFAGVAKSGISSVMFGIMPFGHNLLSHGKDDADAIIEGLKALLAQQGGLR